MIGWNIFCKNPYKVNTTQENWRWFLRNNLDKICKILAYIPDVYHCLLCSTLSNDYSGRPSLFNHIRFWHHWKEIIKFWSSYYVTKSPEEIHELVNFTADGKPKNEKMETMNDAGL